jgi:hypothetical protein
MSIIKTIIQATNDIEDIKITNYDHIKPKAIDNFLKMLCVLKIKELSNRFKAVEIQGKVSHKKFMNLMNEIFNDSYIYQSLYELIFSRFKLMKCSVLSHKEKSFMTKIIFLMFFYGGLSKYFVFLYDFGPALHDTGLNHRKPFVVK